MALNVPRAKLKSRSDRGFSVAASKLWNAIKQKTVYESVFTNILCVSWEVREAKHIVSVTVHLFVLI